MALSPALNQTRQPGAVGTHLSTVDTGKAISQTLFHRGLLFVPMGADHGGGVGDGAFAFYQVDNPAAPQLVLDSRQNNARYHTSGQLNYVGDWAEMHHTWISGDRVLISERRSNSAGLSVFDLAPAYDADPQTLPATLGRMSYAGVTGTTNYEGYSFAIGWQGNRYAYAPTGAQGLYIIDTSNPANMTQLAHVPRSALGNRTLLAAWPIGNLLILADINSTSHVRLYDIGNPVQPVLLSSFDSTIGYHGFVHGDQFHGGGSPIVTHDFGNPSAPVRRQLFDNPGFTNPEYGFGQDDSIFIGHYPGATRWQMNDPNNPSAVTYQSSVNSGLVDDHAFLNPLGNLTILCTDHNNTLKMIFGVSTAAQDTTPPVARFVSPADGAVNQHVLSRVGISFSDTIDPATLTTANFQVRRVSDGALVAGSFSSMLGIVNFVPNQALATNTTYDVVLSAGGVTDQCGNAIPVTTRVASFSTGSTVSTFTVVPQAQAAAVVGSTTNLSATITNPSGISLEHSWSFGDGSAPSNWSASPNASHTWTTPGNHSLTLKTRVTGSDYITGTTTVQVIHRPLAPTPPVSSSTIVVDPDRAVVWNVNPDNNSITAVDSVGFTKIREVEVGAHPVALAIGANDELWVANEAAASLSCLNRASGNVTRTVALPPGAAPRAVLVDRAANVGYVSLAGLGEVAKVNLASGSIVATLSVGPHPRGLALDPQRQRLLVSRFISPDGGGGIARINLSDFSLEPAIQLGPVMAADSLTNGRGIPNYLMTPALSPDLTQGWVPAKKDNVFRGLQRDGQPLTFEFAVRSMAARLDLASQSSNAAESIDFDNSDFPTAATFSPLGNYVFFLTSGSKTLWVIDAWNPANRFSLPSGGAAPDGLAFNADGSRLFVHNFMERSVTVLRTTVACAGVCGSSQQLASIPTVASEALAPQVLVGKKLFYSSDVRLAQEGYMSCASCHLDGGHDGRTWDFTSMGEGLRNTIDLNGRGVGHGPLHWTANFDEVQDFEGQIRSFSQGAGLMSDVDFKQGNRAHPLGQPKAGKSADLDALAAYLSSLQSAGRSPHRQANGSLTAAAQAGRAIFIAENCASCHGGSAFSDSASLARHDVGTLGTASGSRLGGELDGLDTPTLRGLWNSAPYLHDGSAATLEDVLGARDLSGRHAGLFHRSEIELSQLVAYLQSIDDLETTAPAPPPGSSAPVLVAPSAQASILYQTVDLTLAASGGSGALQWSAVGLPPGVAIDAVSGRLRGAPSLKGVYQVRLAVRDDAGRVSSATFAWTVSDPTGRRFVRLNITSTWTGSWSSMAEFNLLGTDGQPLPRAGWTVSGSSAETSQNNGYEQAIDGNSDTHWHTSWSATPLPHHFSVDLGQAERINGMSYQGRPDGENGRLKDWNLAVSDDGVAWTQITSGQFANHNAVQSVTFGSQLAGPPVPLNPPATLVVLENSPTGTQLADLAASAAPGLSTSWSLGAGNAAGLFAIDPASGVLRLAARPDFETQSLHRLQIIVSDSGNPSQTTAFELPIRIGNVIETQGEAVQFALTGTSGAFPGHGNPALIGFNADPDRDGLVNAIEVLFGNDPGSADAAPPVEIFLVVENGKTYPLYQFTTVSGTGLVPQIKGSNGLQQWSDFGATPVLIGQAAGVSHWEVRDPVALEDAQGQRFMRIELQGDE